MNIPFYKVFYYPAQYQKSRTANAPSLFSSTPNAKKSLRRVVLVHGQTDEEAIGTAVKNNETGQSADVKSIFWRKARVEEGSIDRILQNLQQLKERAAK